MAHLHFIHRVAEHVLKRLVRGFPVIGMTGPRQAGKTTLVKHYFTDKPYVSLENPDQLDYAEHDPRHFLEQYITSGVVLDEVQRCPSLLSYLQEIVDTSKRMGHFILTGSQQFGFRAKMTQTLAGRIGLIQLLPFSYQELRLHGLIVNTLDELLYTGFYPPIYDRDVLPHDWYASYVQTYIERDVQQIIHLKHLNTFRTFLRLCAGRAGQVINLNSIGNECGISHNTVKEWLSVLEASYIIFRLPPHFKNFSKRLIKSNKLYFYDTGLLCWLLGIRAQSQLNFNAMRGAVFENYVISELLKYLYAHGEPSNLYFWRDSRGLEIDVIIDQGQKLIPIEIKSSQTVHSDFFKNLSKWTQLAKDEAHPGFLIYAGQEEQTRNKTQVLAWHNLDKLKEAMGLSST